jgi:4-hydroxybutyryl-CoA dehydratase/vinylacetyl-CoA-Delta-isomerase
MALITREQYLESLRKMRPNIYKFDELIEDVTTHPATKATVNTHAHAFEMANNPEQRELVVTKSHFTGEEVMRWANPMWSKEELAMNMKFKRQMFLETGNCHAGQCVGLQAANVMWSVTADIDKKYGTNYQERLKNYFLMAQENGWTISGALTDAKGDRNYGVDNQPENEDAYVHIVERREDGIVVRGCKAQIAGVAASNEIIVVPTTALKENAKDWAVAFAIPRDAEGVTIVESRGPSDKRRFEEGWDAPGYGITQGWIFLDDVFVPNERVFMAGEFEGAGKFIAGFTANYRACIGACVAGQGDCMIGAATLNARANGLSVKKFYDKIIQMALHNENTYGMGLGAIFLGKQHPSGTYIADAKTAHANKVFVATLPQETRRLCQEICSGIVETGCHPSYVDFNSEKNGKAIQKYMKAGVGASAEARARAARLAEYLTVGGGIPGCMHGGGSPDGAKIVVRITTPIEDFANAAKKLAGIQEEISEPAK